MFVVGLTGGIASGKSTVSEILQEKGATLINGDVVGHEAQQEGTDSWKDIIEEWGEDLIDPETRGIDRTKLGPIVFSDPANLQRLNEIMWPRMYSMMYEQLQQLEQEGIKVVILEAALLIEAEWTPLVNEVWVTVVDEASAVERLNSRNGLDEDQALARIRSQLSNDERSEHGNVVLDTNCTLNEVKEKTRDLWNTRIEGKV